MLSEHTGSSTQVKKGHDKRERNHSRHAVHDTDSDVSQLGDRRCDQDKQGQRPSRIQPDNNSDQQSERDASSRVHGRIETPLSPAIARRRKCLRTDHRTDTEPCTDDSQRRVQQRKPPRHEDHPLSFTSESFCIVPLFS